MPDADQIQTFNVRPSSVLGWALNILVVTLLSLITWVAVDAKGELRELRRSMGKLELHLGSTHAATVVRLDEHSRRLDGLEEKAK